MNGHMMSSLMALAAGALAAYPNAPRARRYSPDRTWGFCRGYRQGIHYGVKRWKFRRNSQGGGWR